MWRELPEEEKNEYKRMILAFASLTEMFAQKADINGHLPIPILNSKYQETVFQKVFDAFPEDIGNTSFDVSMERCGKKYLIGLKTFGLKSGEQKVAQFKANHDDWTELFETIKKNSINSNGERKTKEEINYTNESLYLLLAKRIASLRNKRIESSKANLQGFRIEEGQEVESIYHVLMPSCIDNEPSISVGEISYDLIDLDSIEIIGCTSERTPTNFSFHDKNHFYRFTSADCQLLMNFENPEIILEEWSVRYADDAYSFFANLADNLYKREEEKGIVEESYSWSLLNEKGDVELFSGFNGFYGVGSKIGKGERERRIEKLEEKYPELTNEPHLNYVIGSLKHFLLNESSDKKAKIEKASIRDEIVEIVRETGDEVC